MNKGGRIRGAVGFNLIRREHGLVDRLHHALHAGANASGQHQKTFAVNGNPTPVPTNEQAAHIFFGVSDDSGAEEVLHAEGYDGDAFERIADFFKNLPQRSDFLPGNFKGHDLGLLDALFDHVSQYFEIKDFIGFVEIDHFGEGPEDCIGNLFARQFRDAQVADFDFGGGDGAPELIVIAVRTELVQGGFQEILKFFII